MEPLIELALDEGEEKNNKATTTRPVSVIERGMSLLVFKAVDINQRKITRAGASHG